MAAARKKQDTSFDAQIAAREAARREGKTLGEWLHAVIAERAAELGVAESDIVGRERADAVFAGIERSRSGDPAKQRRPLAAGRPAQDRGYGSERVATGARRAALDEDDFAEDTAHPFRRKQPGRYAGEPLASFADLLERNEARRLQERESVNALTDKLASLESKLRTARFDAEDHPIRSALARLEARLDSIGRREVAESAVRESVTAPSSAAIEPVNRFEAKLDTILQAVQIGTARRENETSVAALVEAQRDPPAAPSRRRLGDAIADISRRQRALDGAQRADAPEAAVAETAPAPRATARPAAPSGANKSETDIAALAAKVDALRFDVMVGRRNRSSEAQSALASVRDELDSLSQLSHERDRPSGGATAMPVADRAASTAAAPEAPLAQERSEAREEPSSALQSSSRELSALEQLETRLETLASKVEGALAVKATPVTEPSPAAGDEALLRALGERIEAVQASQADAGALDDLQGQLEQLAHRFEQSEKDLAVLPALADSVSDIFRQLEATRATVEEAAGQAAREAVRSAIGKGESLSALPVGADEIASLRAMQDEADARVRATLTTVHDMLAKVVDRLAQMEGAIGELRDRKPESLPAQGSEARPLGKPTPAAAPSALDLTFAAGASDREPLFRRRRADAPATDAREPADAQGESAQQVDFIAAARRAAQTAQAESLAAASKQPLVLDENDGDARAGLLAKSRAFVASHKRPVLLGVAAVFLVLGAIAVLQRSGLGGSRDIAKRDAQPRTQVAAAAPQVWREPGASTATAVQPGASTKVARPATPLGSDPVPTGSLSRLPAFAAQAAISPPPQAELPPGLRAAAEAGDGAAAYALALRCAEGRGVPRDLKLAAHWFEKAAAAGLAPAQYRLASLYEKGIGVAQDKGKARDLYTKAAEAGNPRAMHNLGVLLADGDGHPDYAGAARWFEMAAGYGVHDSEYNLAILLARGLGVPQSLVQSYKWFAVAALHNDTDAAQKRDEVGAKLSANDLAAAKALASAFTPKQPNPATMDVLPPAGGWDSLAAPSHLNSTKAKVSSL